MFVSLKCERFFGKRGQEWRAARRLLDALTSKERSLLAEIMADSRDVAADWIEDRGFSRSAVRCLEILDR